MVTKDQAEKTHTLAREFYKGQDKAWNKAYWTTGSAGQTSEIENSATPTKKQLVRNQQVAQNYADMVKAGRDSPKEPPVQWGQKLYNAQRRIGNCGEMAAVAIYIAVNQVHIDPKEAWMWTLWNNRKAPFFSSKKDASFGHTFALLGAENDKMDQKWVVDPWSNVCCTLAEYKKTLTDKLEEWSGEGKRIAANTEDGYCWVDPKNKLITDVLNAQKVKMIRADQL